ncbi:MAG: hypothetical protein IKS74_02325 [Methanomicrobium sp.]|nr:hypothetical protein [Methanomicrobium sp.]
MNSEYKDKIAELLKKEGIDTVITCEQALSIAKNNDIPVEDIGKFCNSRGIKIRQCQLGCFK